MKQFCKLAALGLLAVMGTMIAACGAEPQSQSESAHEHEYALEWSKDETYHYHAPLCGDTTEPKEKAEHSYDADHKCTVCGYTKAGLGTITATDVTAWSDVESEFKLVFSDESKAEAVTYEYDDTKIVIDAEHKTIKAVEGAMGPVQVKVRSQNHKTATFTVTCNEQPPKGAHKYSEYAQKLGRGVLVDDNGNDTGETYSVTENTTVFIGDSFFDRRWFWTDFYTDDFSGKDAFLAGISEATTNDWEIYMDEVFAGLKNTAPKNIVIHLGTNNIGTGQTAAETENGLRHFLTLLHKKFPQTKIYYFAITSRWDDGGASYNAIINDVNGQTQTWCKDKSWIRFVNTAWLITKDKLNPNHGGSYIHPLITTYSIFVEELQKTGCVIADKV